MYNSGMVVAVKINGKTVEEKDGKIVIPFDSEYSLMLKNRNDRKAVARIYIDGKEVTEKGRLIIDANGYVDVERYIDDMDNGGKFKFVPVSDGRVNDKGDSEKGYIEVRFQLVKPVLNNFIVHEHHEYHHHVPYRPFYYSVGDYPTFGTLTFNNSGGNSLSAIANGQLSNFTNNASVGAKCQTFNTASIEDNHLVEESGATIKGSNSSQRFSYAYVGELESNEIVIRFQLTGTTDSNIISKYCKIHCVSCGKTYGVNDMFCSVCGVKR